MPNWLTTTLYIIGAVAAFAGSVSVIRAKLIRPLIDGWNEILDIFRRLLSAAEIVQRFAAEIHGLSGAFTLFAVEIKQQVDENTERLDRLEERNDLVVDLQADVERIQREFRPGP